MAEVNCNGFPAGLCLKKEDSVESNAHEETGTRFNLRKRKPVPEKQQLKFPMMNGVHEDIEENGISLSESISPKKRKYGGCPKGKLQEALALVQAENISVSEAAKRFELPRSSLRTYALTAWSESNVKGSDKNLLHSKQEMSLSQPEEAYLVSLLMKMAQAGKHVNLSDIKSSVQHLLDESQRIVFRDRNRPSCGWVARFKKRHALLESKGFGGTNKLSYPMSEREIREWHRKTTEYLETEWELDPSDFFASNPHRIFNVDEMILKMNLEQHELKSFGLSASAKGEVGVDELTILSCVNAAGEVLQPLIIQKGEIDENDSDMLPLDQTSYGIAFSLSGNIGSEIFLKWLQAFDKELGERNIDKPVVIYLDDTFSHFHMPVFSYASDNDIILLCLPFFKEHALMPVVSEVHNRVHSAYRSCVREYYKEYGQLMTLDQFPFTFLKAFESVRDDPTTKACIIGSFEHYGLAPLNPNHSSWSRCALKEGLVKMCGYERNYRDFLSSNTKTPKARKTGSPTGMPITDSGITKKDKKTYKTSTNDQAVVLTSDTKTSKSSNKASKGLVPRVDICKLEQESLDGSGSLYGTAPPSPSHLISQRGFSISENYASKSDLPWRDVASQNSHSNTPKKDSGLTSSRLLGRESGILKCCSLMESFVPPDLIPVWNTRFFTKEEGGDVPYNMWSYVRSLLKEVQAETLSHNEGRNRLSREDFIEEWDVDV